MDKEVSSIKKLVVYIKSSFGGPKRGSKGRGKGKKD